MRYIRHLVLWALWGLSFIGTLDALLSGLTVGVFSYLRWSATDWFGGSRIEDAFSSVGAGAMLGAIEGAIGGTIVFLGLAIARPPLKPELQRLWLVTRFLGACLVVGTPVLGLSLLAVNEASIDSLQSRYGEIR